MPYTTELEFSDFLTARGEVVTDSLLVLLTKANDYLETREYKGQRTDPTQVTAFPREGILIDGVTLPSDTIPARIKQAEMQLALELSRGNDPLAPINPRKTKESIGELEVQYSYSPTDPLVQTLRSVNALLRPFLKNNGGLGITRG